MRGAEKGPGRPTGVLLAGVGGQGIILAADLLSLAALESGLEVKKSEVHGMAQRGGSVVSHVRFGAVVHSPLIPEGEADILAAFEEMEALRYLPLLREGGALLVNRQRIYTLAMLTGGEPYPEGALHEMRDLPVELLEVDGPALAREAGNPRTANLALLGALSSRLPFGEPTWRRVLEGRLAPKLVEANWKAFILGREAAGAGPSGGMTAKPRRP